MTAIKEKKAALIQFFKIRLTDQMAEVNDADQSQMGLLRSEISKTQFVLKLLENEGTEFNNEWIDLTDKKIELLYEEYVRSADE